MEMRILEVTPIDMEDSEQQIPGTIVKSDALFGIIVACINKEFLRITIMHGIEGYVSGIKLFLLGIKEGSRFYNKNDQAAKSH
jgi:methionyl-tRNA formyltransferase